MAQTDSFTTAGTFTWTSPLTGTVSVLAIGGGAGSGASATLGEGGGSGGDSAYSALSVTSGVDYTVVVGASGVFGGAGGSSYFLDDGTIFASGGVSGTASTGGTTDGSNSIGDTVFAGGAGGNGGGVGTGGGGGGGGAGQTGAGGAGSANSLTTGGAGGIGGAGGGGAGGAGGNAAAVGNVGVGIGGGGGGGGAGANGKAGHAGAVYITYTLPTPDVPPTVPGNLSPTTSGILGFYYPEKITGKNDGDAITTWLDGSGFTYNVTQGTAGLRPHFSVGTSRNSVLFAAASSTLLSAVLPGIDVSSGATIISLAQRAKIADAYQCPASVTGASSFGMGATSQDAGAQHSHTGIWAQYAKASFGDTNDVGRAFAAPDASYSILVARWGGSLPSIAMDNGFIVTGSDQSSNLTAKSATGISIGGFGASTYADGRLLPQLIFSRALSASEIQGWAAYLCAYAGISLPSMLIVPGDSRPYGYIDGSDPNEGGITGNSPVAQLVTALGTSVTGWFCKNSAVAGYTQLDINAYLPTIITQANVLRGKQIVIMQAACRNAAAVDTPGHRTGAEIWADYLTGVQLLQAAGIKVIGLTDPISTTFANIAGDFNALVRANTGLFDGYVDVAADPAFSDPTNLTYYLADGSHWAQAGRTAWATRVSGAARQLISSSTPAERLSLGLGVGL